MSINKISIPPIVHYCWFGNGEIPENLKGYMKSWKEFLPDWEYKCWNEQTFDIEHSIPYVQEAYARKKFAFVSDYVRLCALRDYGGVYLDTDVQILQSFEPLLKNPKEELIIGFETKQSLITAFIASKPKCQILCDFIESYTGRHFLLENGDMDLTTINDAFTKWMQQYGLVLNNQEQMLCNGTVHVYPYEYFTGSDIENAHPKITDNTYTVHHFQSSWKKSKVSTWIKYKIIVRGAQKILGYDRYDRLKDKMGL